MLHAELTTGGVALWLLEIPDFYSDVYSIDSGDDSSSKHIL